jgi:tetratricopeptide (TPR) repeat protein
MLRTALLALLLSLPDWTFFSIGRTNRLKEQAAAAFRQRNYLSAMVQYRYLRYNYGLAHEEITLNLGHCYYQLGDTLNARRQYAALGGSPNRALRTVALQQLGVLAFRGGRREQALALFKSALQANPANDGARYNFELLSEQYAVQTTHDTVRLDIPPAPLPPPDEPQQAGSDHSEPDEDGGTGAGKPPPSAEAGLSPERAEMLLKAIQSQENEYLRQRQDASSKRVRSPYKGPDW